MTRLEVRVGFALAVALLNLALGVGTAHAQAMPTPPWDPSQLIPDPGKFATEMFNSALLKLGRETTDKLATLIESLFGGSLISQTPPEASYDNESVRQLWGKLRLAANGGLTIIGIWGGFNLMVNPHIRAPYHGALELVPRLLLGGVLINTSLDWGRFAIDVNNLLCQLVRAAPSMPETPGMLAMPGWQAFQESGSSPFLVYIVAGGIYLFMGLMLVGQMLMRLALVDVLLILAPLALLCWVLPQTQNWARLWFTTFFGTVFVQLVQVVVLQLGTDLSTSLVTLLPRLAADPTGAAPGWLATLALGMAVLQLTRKVPRLMPGYPGGGDNWSPLRLFSMRQVSSLMSGDRGRPRGGRG